MENIIYKYLEKKNSPYKDKIDSLCKISEKILGQIPAFFSNYTLHDIGHASRVIHHASFFLDDLSMYSDLHLAMIIYAGLMHDYGMFVSDEKKDEIVHYLSEKDENFVNMSSENKYICTQNFIRDIHADRVKEVVNDSEKLKKEIATILTYDHSYDLSEIIFKICASHTKDCEWIEENLEDNMTFGNDVISPSHIAILLRLGDCLDIDAQRAPAFLCELLHVKGYSNEEWRMHLPITNYDKVFVQDSIKNIKFDGATDDPEIYRRVEEYLGWIRTEIPRINELLEDFPRPFSLRISETITDTIKTNGFAKSEYNFTLSYDKLSKLLMGEHIYGNKQAGLRELLQNSIDAVQTMKAIFDKDPNHDFPYYPSIIISFDKKSNILSIADNGTGMSKKILKEYFFNIGNSFYSSHDFAKIDCGYKPIGHFGIGFLACFMLSKNVTLITKHYDSSEAVKMEFERDSNFSISRKVSKKEYSEDHGTKILLQYDQIIDSIFKDEDDLIRYVKNLILPNGFKISFKSDNELIDEYERYLMPRNISIYSDNDMDIYYTVSSIPDIIDCCEALMLPKETLQFYVNKDLPFGEDLVGSCFLIEDLSACINVMSDKYDIFEIKNKLSRGESLAFEGNEDYSPNLVSTVEHILMESSIPCDKCDSPIDYLQKSIINLCYENGHINYLRMQYINDKDRLLGFVKEAKEDGYENAVRMYRKSISSFSVLGISKDELSQEQLIGLLDYVVGVEGGNATYGDFLEIPFKIQEIEQEVIPSIDSFIYLPLEYDKPLNSPLRPSLVYVRGIRIAPMPIRIPCSISGLSLARVMVNLKGSRYELDVSRDKLTSVGAAAFKSQFAKNLYTSLLETNSSSFLSEDEISLWGEFITKYLK